MRFEHCFIRRMAQCDSLLNHERVIKTTLQGFFGKYFMQHNLELFLKGNQNKTKKPQNHHNQESLKQLLHVFFFIHFITLDNIICSSLAIMLWRWLQKNHHIWAVLHLLEVEVRSQMNSKVTGCYALGFYTDIQELVIIFEIPENFISSLN